MANKKELKSMLYELSTPEERKNLATYEINGLDTRIEYLQQKVEDTVNGTATKTQMEEVAVSLRKFKNEFGIFLTQLAETQKALTETLSKGFKELNKPTKQQDFSGFFKDFPTLLSQIGSNTGDTNKLIQNLKWNASQQLRDVNGSPINPAISPFGITATYDDIKLTNYDGSGNVGTVTYYQNGQVKAILSLTYDGSGNLIDATRSQ